jgi:hypothetical protein
MLMPSVFQEYMNQRAQCHAQETIFQVWWKVCALLSLTPKFRELLFGRDTILD